MENSRKQLCEVNLISAYIDGELEITASLLFETHLDDCQNCRAELRLHQQFMCELDSALANEPDVVVPANFSQMVAARAVSDMSGVRSRAENRKALVFCVILGIAGFVLIGPSTRQMTLNLTQRSLSKFFGFIDLAWHAVYDLVASIAVISRVLSRKFIVETGNLGVALVLLAFAAFLLSRLLTSYHRTDAIE